MKEGEKETKVYEDGEDEGTRCKAEAKSISWLFLRSLLKFNFAKGTLRVELPLGDVGVVGWERMTGSVMSRKWRKNEKDDLSRWRSYLNQPDRTLRDRGSFPKL